MPDSNQYVLINNYSLVPEYSKLPSIKERNHKNVKPCISICNRFARCAIWEKQHCKIGCGWQKLQAVVSMIC